MNINTNLRELPRANKLLEGIRKREFTHLKEIDAFSYQYKVEHWKPYKRSRYVHKNLINIIAHPEILEKAYYEVRSNKGALTVGTNPDNTLDGTSRDRIGILSEQIKRGTYEFSDIRRIWIPKPGKKEKRPLGIPSGTDKIVQTAIMLVLTNIFEPEFQIADFNYGFRPNKSCHNALEVIKLRGQSINFFIEGDIKGAYDKVHHDTLIKILSRRISDQKFLKLIKKLLKTGIMDKHKKLNSITGVPQGGTLSPLLWNIYSYEFDIFVHEYLRRSVETYKKIFKKKSTPEFNKILKTKRQCEYKRRKYKKKCIELSQKIDTGQTESTLEEYRHLRRELQKETELQRSIPGSDYPPERSARLEYVRYADDWIIMLTGPISLAKMLTRKCKNFLIQELNLTLSTEKTKITNPNKQPILFLGHNIFQIPVQKITTKTNNLEKNKIYKFLASKTRSTYRNISFRIPWKKKLIPKLIERKFCNEHGFPTASPYLSVLDDGHIIRHYNQVLLDLANYYSKFCIKRDTNRLWYICTYSCYKTLAQKHRTSMKKIIQSYKTSESAVEYGTKKNGKYYKVSIQHYLSYKPSPIFKEPNINPITANSRTKFHLYCPCTICNHKVSEIHHIKPIRKRKKSINNSNQINIIAKQIPLCRKCHMGVHSGKINIQDILKKL